jgi:hypothetical protein
MESMIFIPNNLPGQREGWQVPLAIANPRQWDKIHAEGHPMPETMTITQAHTLYDDWRARREKLSCAPGEPTEYRAIEIRLLDYLLRRYKDSPEAAQPALFPLPKSAFINHRAIIVHHHLGRGSIPTISNRHEAYVHVRSMIEHMWIPPENESASAADEETPSFIKPPKIDPVEAVREKLCDADSAVRVRAAVKLGEIGTLDDIGFLSDLLSLPYSLDEHPKERAALLHAMQRLSGTTKDEFDLTGVPPAPKLAMEPDPSVTHARDRREYSKESFAYSILQVLAVIMFTIGAAIILSVIASLWRSH